MRLLALTTLAIATLLSAAPGSAQTYNPDYPVCLHMLDRGAIYYECEYTSIPQCQASASGRSAECVVNPYFAGAGYPPSRAYPRYHAGHHRYHRRHHRHVD